MTLDELAHDYDDPRALALGRLADLALRHGAPAAEVLHHLKLIGDLAPPGFLERAREILEPPAPNTTWRP